MLVVHPFRPRDPVRLDYLDEEPLVACLILGAMMAVFLFLLGVVFGEPWHATRRRLSVPAQVSPAVARSSSAPAG